MKLCKESDHPGWIKRTRNKILENPEINSRKGPENDISDIDDIGNQFGTDDAASDSLMLPDSSTNLVSSPGGTPPYQSTNTCRGKRLRKAPQYLSDYV